MIETLALVETLLRAYPQLQVLASNREAIGIILPDETYLLNNPG